MTLPTGTRLGPYETLSALVAGGMEEVFKARDTWLGRDVAVKVLPSHLSDSPDLRARFERDSRAIAALSADPALLRGWAAFTIPVRCASGLICP